MLSPHFSENRKRRAVLLRVLIVAITLLAVAVAIFLSNQTYRETRKMAIEQFHQQELILARWAATGIKGFVGHLKDDLLALSGFPVVQKMEPGILETMKLLSIGAHHFQTSYRRLDRNGILRFINCEEHSRKELIGRDYSKEAYFQKAKETGEVVLSGLVINEMGERRIRVARPVYVEDKNGGREFNGVIIASFDPATLYDLFIAPIVAGKTGNAWLLNHNGRILAHYEEGFVGRNAFEARHESNPDIDYKALERIQGRMMAGEEGMGSYVSGWHRGLTGKIDKLVAYTPIRLSNHIWSVAVCTPVSEVEETIRIIKRSELYTLGFVILALVLCGGFFLSNSYRWSRSLKREVASRTGELKETRDYLNNLIRHASGPIVVWDPEGRVTIFNEAFEKMSGWSRAEMMGQPVELLLPEESRSESMQKILSASEGEYRQTVEIPILRKDGEIRIGMLNSSNIYDKEGKLIATIAQGQDISERKHLEAQLRQSQKIEAVGNLAGGVAHDFNNILSAIIGNADLALMSIEKDHRLNRNLDEINRSARRAATLTRQLLLFSRRQPMDMVPLNLTSLTQNLGKMLDRLIGEDISLGLDLEPETWTIEGDAGTIEQVIMNLVVNARDAMPEGGEINIRTGNIHVDQEYCTTHTYARPGKFVYLSVRDNGTGMEQTVIDRIFEPFFTTKEVGKGTGLGLSVVYGIIKEHKGWIDVESSPDNGAIFHVYLPAGSMKLEEKEEATVSLEALIGRGERVLLVEDDKALSETAENALSKKGYTVFVAGNMQEALHLFQQEGGKFDLIFCDVVLPDGKGPKLVEELLEIRPGAGVLFTSGHIGEKSAWSAIKESGYPYLQKPYSLTDLLIAIKDALKKE